MTKEIKKEMFINAERDECRIAIVAAGTLSELYVERASQASQVGNIYKGRITNVEPSIQAAFVDFGTEKNGFLHISDLHPQYFPGQNHRPEAVGRKRARKERPPIQSCLRRGQELIVQVTKEGVGTKGATLTTYLSIPGRYLVLMPGMHRLGVSRKIEDEAARAKARSLLQELKPPPEMGFIVRTAGLDRPKQDLQRDLNYLLRLWKAVSQRSKEARAPAELYQESDLVIRTIRDVYTTEIDRIVCDDEAVACKVKEFLRLILPRSAHRVELYSGEVSLFHAFGLEAELEGINSPHVPLPSGGSIVIDQTEALVAIDVNSGRFRDTEDAETTAVRINTEAAREVARQLRLRDLGGVIVIDFIDMTVERHRRKIEKLLRQEVKKDRARTKLLRMSRFGIVEMTRQRVRPSLASSIFQPCPCCGGSGRVKSAESQSLAAMRLLRLAASDPEVATIELTVSAALADHLLNYLRDDISEVHQRTGTNIRIHVDPEMPADRTQIHCLDARGSQLGWDPTSAMRRRAGDVPTREITKAEVEAFRKRTAGAAPAEAPAEPAPVEAPAPKKKKKRRPKRKAKPQPESIEAPPAESKEQPPKAKKAKPARKRPRRARSEKKDQSPQPPASDEAKAAAQETAEQPPAEPEGRAGRQAGKKSTGARRKRKRTTKAQAARSPGQTASGSQPGPGDQARD
ncbi:MAG: hypothetical protein B1H04_00880 [Planctomycetales bacterium 4484_123]|nr:MAG: hypothetical protein B1H04_00880 [Planctomycetales bacterium 4484_123]